MKLFCYTITHSDPPVITLTMIPSRGLTLAEFNELILQLNIARAQLHNAEHVVK